MGEIIYWGILRFAIVLFGCWFLFPYADNYGEWWSLFFVSVGAVVLYPAQLAYRKHQSQVRKASRNGLCTNCKHYIADSTLCDVTDEHVSQNYTPCEGEAWEPIEIARWN